MDALKNADFVIMAKLLPAADDLGRWEIRMQPTGNLYHGLPVTHTSADWHDLERALVDAKRKAIAEWTNNG